MLDSWVWLDATEGGLVSRLRSRRPAFVAWSQCLVLISIEPPDPAMVPKRNVASLALR